MKNIKFMTLIFSVCVLLLISDKCSAQNGQSWKLEKFPLRLESDFALSALPLHLRNDATVYLLDPLKGYYIARKGSNGFICFVVRTEWEWGIFRQDIATPVSYDREGTRTVFKIYQDVAAMRASGKYTALQIRDTVMRRINRKIYEVPTRSGISYMLAPVMRNYAGNPGDNKVMTMSVPHHMFYAPYLTNVEIGNIRRPYLGGPIVVNPGSTIFGAGKGPYGYIILPVGVTEKAEIIRDNKDLLKRLTEYKPYFNIEMAASHH